MTKRIFDIFLSLVFLIISLPLLLLAALFIKCEDGGPVFFKQERVGKEFSLFHLIKLRTMVVNAQNSGPLITAGYDQRITKVGRVLRKFKWDELPQFYNVLKGEMSLVGPRPEVQRYIDLFRDDYKDILRIKPGITDLAAIQFRDEEKILAASSDPESCYVQEILPRKIVLYRKYLREKDLWLDIKIICRTLISIFPPHILR